MPAVLGTGYFNLSHDLWQTRMGSAHSSQVESPISARVGSFVGPPGLYLSVQIRSPYTTSVCYHPYTILLGSYEVEQPGIT